MHDDLGTYSEYQAESTAVIHQSAKIGANTYIGHFCVIGPNVTIGHCCRFTAYCEIREGCVLGNNVSMGSRCTLSAGTIVCDGAQIKYGFVATDTPRVGEKERQPCTLKKNSKFGANVTIMPGVIVGENTQIGACSQVRHHVPDGETWYGNPAKKKE